MACAFARLSGLNHTDSHYIICDGTAKNPRFIYIDSDRSGLVLHWTCADWKEIAPMVADEDFESSHRG